MPKHTRAFTLVEILIVVIILGILAAIVIPQFANSTSDAKTNTLKFSLQTLRKQIDLFQLQHDGKPPKDDKAFARVMAGKTGPNNVNTDTPGGTIGPYLTAMPANPLNNFTSVSDAPAANVGWVYQTTATTADGLTYYVYTLSATDTLGTSTLTY